jgi:hypothetical protein
LLLALVSFGLGDKGVDTLENLFDVLVDGCGVLGLTDNFKQIVIGQEVETWEVNTLRTQEVLESLLDALKLVVLVGQELEEVLSAAN